MTKNLKNNYDIESARQENLCKEKIELKDFQDEIRYLKEKFDCDDKDIRIVYVAAVGEIVIYLNDKFLGYLDSYFLNDMDEFNNSK